MVTTVDTPRPVGIAARPDTAGRPWRPPTPRATRVWLVLASVTACAVTSCGMKADPRPPALVRPSTINDLAAEATTDGIRLTWTRPTTTMDGKSMPDLDGILITRAIDVAPPTKTTALLFEHIATIHLDDRERFHKVRRMSFDDRSVTPDETYAYRVQAFTFDGYFGAPSPPARAMWPGHGRPSARREPSADPGARD